MCIETQTSLGTNYEPFPKVKHPKSNPWSKEKLKLGKKLFFDPVLSGDNTISCGTCHQPEKGWTDGLERGRGFNKIILGRNTPSILNTGYYDFQFWDGRALSLEEQAKAPIQSPEEMNQDINELIKELEADSEYLDLFQKAFGDNKISLDKIVKAIAVFERTIVSSTSPYDRFRAGEKNALSEKAKKGMKLFFGKAKCSICHNGPLFTDQQFHNIGVSGSNDDDVGRQKVTSEKFHIGTFKTPGLRDLSRTGPYMHNGSIPTLEKTIDFYDRGGEENSNKSPFISPIGMSSPEKENLLEFIKSLASDSSEPYEENP